MRFDSLLYEVTAYDGETCNGILMRQRDIRFDKIDV